MPSLFSRTRTSSTPKKSDAAVASSSASDEFGRINSRDRGRPGLPTPPGSKKDKRSKKDLKAAAHGELENPPVEYALPDGAFLPLNLDPPRFDQDDEPRSAHDYGYLAYQRHVVLGLEEAARLVDVVGIELSTRGLTTPFIFSALALDVSTTAVRRLIRAFLRTCAEPGPAADMAWREEARLAGPHELGMCLRWGLARVVRIVRGQEVRGLLSFADYMGWRDAEQAHGYPEAHFASFLSLLDPLLQTLLVGLLTLLSRFASHSASSGHTPPTLSPLFGPLLFGLGPSTLAFHHVYMYYLRATTSTEHLMLAFVRWQDAQMPVPPRLKMWIQGYPSMLPSFSKNDRPQPRRGARTVRVVSVRRNVRLYSADLVKTAAAWGFRRPGPTSSSGDRSLANSKEWARIAPADPKLAPRYSDNYRKRMDLPTTFHPDAGSLLGSVGSSSGPPSLSSSVSTASSSSLFDEKDHAIGKAGEDRFRNLTDLKWGEFEVMGFSNATDEKKLQFDLTEGARAARAAKRSTLTWQDFSSSGFTRTDVPLNATLQFSVPVVQTVNNWPDQKDELSKKLRKAQKHAPSFGWDTEPVMGNEELIEEAFLDVFCDLIYGGGWMDRERWEDIHRDCNWALVEFKSLPVGRSTTSGNGDPRANTTLMLFEEFVPLEYRQQLLAAGAGKRRLPSLFGTSRPKAWKPAATLNGRPYVVGHVPNSPSYREAEFEGLLRADGETTKIISLAKSPSAEYAREARREGTPAGNSLAPPAPEHSSPLSISTSPIFNARLRIDSRADSPMLRMLGRSDTPESPSPSKRRFRLPVSPGGGMRRSTYAPAEYENVDFETRLASLDSEDSGKGKRRQSKDDAWVDILVANSSRRMGGQDAEMRNGLRSGRSDPELASQEVKEVLAAVQNLSMDDDEGMEPVSPPYGATEQVMSSDVHGAAGDDTATTSEAPERESALYGDDEEEEEEEEYVERPRIQQRVGYFDLHPERRSRLTLDEDAQQPIETPSVYSDKDHDDVPDVSPPLPSTNATSPDTTKPIVLKVSPPDEVSPPANKPSSPPNIRGLPTSPAAMKVGLSPSLAPSPPSSTNGPAAIPAATPAATPAASPSKTASLIEMYRERERSATLPAASVAPASRLPVRSATSPQPPLATAVPVAPSAPTMIAVPPLQTTIPPREPDAVFSDTEESDIDNESIVSDKEPSLPNRYVHGAPLHNVLEEEEEEE